MSTYAERVRLLFRKYGKIGVATHLSIYAATFSGCYYAAESNVNLARHLEGWGLLSDRDVAEDKDPDKRGIIARNLTNSGSSFALAFLCTKALLPVRVPLTVAITPAIARVLQQAPKV